jgi:prepilin-type N-terminal cleavage/methylation domain-containing protein
MLSRLPGTSRSAGFSMLEALIALAIAAILSIAATRGLATTRVNAFKLREQLAIDAVADNLVNRVAERKLEEGRTSGRTGNLDWHIEVAPVTANARVLYSKPKKLNDANSANGPQAGAAPSAPDSSASTLATHPLSNSPAGQDGAGPPKKAVTVWQTFRVAVAVVARSGRRLEMDAIRIGPLDAAKEAREQ